MKKALRITLRFLGVLLLVLLIVGFIGWIYLKNSFIDFEEDYQANTSLKTITHDGYSFVDRNGNGRLDIYEDSRADVSARVENLLSQMTPEEKIHLLKGSGLASAMGRRDDGVPGVVGTIVATPRLGIPEINLSDGPAGLRIEPTRNGKDRTFYCTAFPIATLLASTWNTELVEEVGAAMGNEAVEYGIDVILGPGANIHRHPFCGRNFEYYSEDPLVTGKIGAAMVNGIESQGVGTSVKHFVANNQETNRNFNDTQVSDRAMREIYLKGFEIIIKESNPWTIMSSYNKVNGTYTSESHDLLTGVLRDDWGYDGLVMSDWFGGSDAVAMIKAGNDLLEPGTKIQWDALLEGYEAGALNMNAIDTSVRRILSLIFKTRKMENYAYRENPDLKAHAVITRNSAAEGIILLKNQQSLPLTPNMNVALIGTTSFDIITGGTGSGDVNEAYQISLEQGLVNTGYTVNQEAKALFKAHKSANEKAFERPEGIGAMFNPYLPPQMTYSDAQMKQLAATSDIGVFTIGRNSGEGGDRHVKDDFLLSAKEIKIMEQATREFHAAGKKLIVVLNIGGVIETDSWKNQPDAILLAWQGGQEGGNAIADVLSGAVNPSGKLTMSFPVNIEDHASHKNFPLDGKPMSMTDFIFPKGADDDEEPIKNVDYTVYEEGIYVGYRHFDKAGLEVSYPFGFGLSYTDFELGDMKVITENDTIKVSVTVKNIGNVPGKEVVQIYTSKTDSQIDRPKQELRAFKKTGLLQPNAVDSLKFSIPTNNLRHWNESNSKWALERGIYTIKAGTSSRDAGLIGNTKL